MLVRKVRGVRRRGKYLLLDFGDVHFVVHLMQGGRLLVEGERFRSAELGDAIELLPE